MKIIKKIKKFTGQKKISACLLILFFSSLLALIFAYIAQYVFGLEPCKLCFYQRKPFFFIIILSAFARFLNQKEFWQKTLLWCCLFLLLINSAIAFYHAGVEKKIFKEPQSCGSAEFDKVTDLQELSKIIVETVAVRCDEPKFFFLGLTMAQWNFLYCSGLLAVIVQILGKSEKKLRKKLI